jgi:hypothetical protein
VRKDLQTVKVKNLEKSVLNGDLWKTIVEQVDSASNRNEYQECFLGVKAAGADNLATFLCRLS